ncbi:MULTISPECIES: hypothetical protein [Bradyrhizobium]|uniref:hypothetical protein n=1 Tax=Bradyrhizobium pachyrhizi TaxID=280333 RepID=UPI0003FDD770
MSAFGTIKAASVGGLFHRHEINAKGDQYVFIGMAGTQKATISWASASVTPKARCIFGFLHDLRARVIGQPEISTGGFHPYRTAIRDAFGDGASHISHLRVASFSIESPSATGGRTLGP